MIRYIVKRILWLVPVVLCVAILIFTLMHFIDGDPARMLVGIDATEEEYQAVRTRLGLDEPFFYQLGIYLRNFFLRGDMGVSYMTRVPVAETIKARVGYSLLIGFASIAIGTIVGVLLGIASAIHAGKWPDKVSMIFALLGVSMPTFWLSLLFLLVFAVKLKWLPPSGFSSVKSFILPVLSVTIHGIATFARQTRSSMLEVIRSDYITTAKSKGLSKKEVIFKHALPNALIPVVTIVGTAFGAMISGSVVIETIYSIPGMGLLLVTGINNRDYPVVQSCIIVISIVFCITMVLVDIVYAFLDPRIKARYISSAKKRSKAV